MGDGSESIDNTDVVLWHTFGVTHGPSPEDFPVMPREPMTLLLRPRNFFTNNPVMDVPPSYSSTPSQVAAKGAGAFDGTDKESKLFRRFNQASAQSTEWLRRHDRHSMSRDGSLVSSIRIPPGDDACVSVCY